MLSTDVLNVCWSTHVHLAVVSTHGHCDHNVTLSCTPFRGLHMDTLGTTCLTHVHLAMVYTRTLRSQCVPIMYTLPWSTHGHFGHHVSHACTPCYGLHMDTLGTTCLTHVHLAMVYTWTLWAPRVSLMYTLLWSTHGHFGHHVSHSCTPCYGLHMDTLGTTCLTHVHLAMVYTWTLWAPRVSLMYTLLWSTHGHFGHHVSHSCTPCYGLHMDTLGTTCLTHVHLAMVYTWTLWAPRVSLMYTLLWSTHGHFGHHVSHSCTPCYGLHMDTLGTTCLTHVHLAMVYTWTLWAPRVSLMYTLLWSTHGHFGHHVSHSCTPCYGLHMDTLGTTCLTHVHLAMVYTWTLWAPRVSLMYTLLWSTHGHFGHHVSHSCTPCYGLHMDTLGTTCLTHVHFAMVYTRTLRSQCVPIMYTFPWSTHGHFGHHVSHSCTLYYGLHTDTAITMCPYHVHLSVVYTRTLWAPRVSLMYTLLWSTHGHFGHHVSHSCTPCYGLHMDTLGTTCLTHVHLAMVYTWTLWAPRVSLMYTSLWSTHGPCDHNVSLLCTPFRGLHMDTVLTHVHLAMVYTWTLRSQCVPIMYTFPWSTHGHFGHHVSHSCTPCYGLHMDTLGTTCLTHVHLAMVYTRTLRSQCVPIMYTLPWSTHGHCAHSCTPCYGLHTDTAITMCLIHVQLTVVQTWTLCSPCVSFTCNLPWSTHGQCAHHVCHSRATCRSLHMDTLRTMCLTHVHLAVVYTWTLCSLMYT